MTVPSLQSLLEVERGQGGRETMTSEDQSSSELSGCHALEFLFLVLQNLPENRSEVDAWSFESNRTVEEKQPRFLWKSPWHRGLRLKQPFKTVTIFVQERGMIC